MRRLLLVLLVACGGSDPAPAKTVALCKLTLPPRQAVPAPLPPVAPPAVTHPSRIVAMVELKLASIVKELEAKVPLRLAEERDRPAGAAGHLNYTVDRGPFTGAVEHDAFVVRTDIHAHAEACKGNSCYASCAPEGKATATISLRLTPDYRFAPSQVAFTFSKGCEVKVLGGFLRIDVTPTIGAQIQPSLRRVEQQVDASLPPIRPQAEKLWAELAKPRPLPLGGCVNVHARGLVEGPIGGTPEALRVRLGLVAYPEIQTRPCEAASPPGALPPLVQDPLMPPEDDVVLALVSPLASANIIGGPVTRAAIVQSGGQAQLDVTLHGESCGDATILAVPEWSDDRSSLHFAADLVSAQSFNPAIVPSALPAVVPALASSMSDASANVSAKVSSTQPLSVALRDNDIVAYLLARGSISISQK